MTDKIYIFQCLKCKQWFKDGNGLRVWEKEVLYDKIEPGKPEKEGEMMWCKECYDKLSRSNFILKVVNIVKKVLNPK